MTLKNDTTVLKSPREDDWGEREELLAKRTPQ